MSRQPIHQSTQDTVFEASSGLCVYCGDLAGTIDHVIPVSAGGTNKRTNLVAACSKCNHAAHNWVFATFEEKKRYVILKRFGKAAHYRAFREEYALSTVR